jgi:tetratricopeptide (TPR) repeat protein
MTLYEENILQSLVHGTSLQDVSKEQLQELITKYPYYHAPYFFFAKKTYLQKEVNNENAVQKAALHFSNDLWFRFNLSNEESPENEEEVNLGEGEQIEPMVISEDDHDDDTEVKEDINEKLSGMLRQQAAEFDKPVEVVAEIPVEITPYHRVDYFDSQGIKLEEEKVTDKLGTQLKRFTEWLKQMKRINPNPADLGNDEAGETEVQHIAEDSNKTREIITETMAEVLVKQGKPEQAIQIYEKLSFNNPSKSVYFAAKIEELKG